MFFLIIFSSCAVIKHHTEADVWSNVDYINRAFFETKDGETLNELVSGNVTYGHSGGSIEDKATLIRKAGENKSVYSDITTEKLSISFSGNNAIVRFNYRALEKKGNEVAPLNLGVLQVWELSGKKWILLARQAVKIAPLK